MKLYYLRFKKWVELEKIRSLINKLNIIGVIALVVLGAFQLGKLSIDNTMLSRVLGLATETTPNPTPTITPFPTNQPMPTPNPTSAPQVKGQAVQREPVIDCIGPDGGHLRITQKECDDFNNAWKKTQQSNTPSVHSRGSTQTGSSSEPTITCVLSYGTYQLTQASCDSWKNTDKPYIPPQYYSCTLCYPTLGTCSTYNYLYETKEQCDVEQQRIDQQYGQNSSPNSIPTTDTSAEQITQCQSTVTQKYTSLIQSCNQYSEGVKQACVSIYTSQRQGEYDACG